MNIGIMQLSNIVVNTKGVSRESSTIASSKSTAKNSFQDVFNKVKTTPQNDTPIEKEQNDSIDLEKLENFLTSQSTEEVMDSLEIPHDEGLLLLQMDEDGQAIAFDEMMSMENLLSVLNIDQSQLLETVQQLTGKTVEGVEDIWQLMNAVLENETEIVQQLITALNGEQKATPKQAEQLLKFLKLSQISGKNSDLLTEQSATLEELKNMLKSVAGEIQNNIQTTKNLSGKVYFEGFEQVVQKIVKTAESIEKTETSESTKTNVVPTTNLTNQTKTISIMLPTEKGAQSEALAKEIQNLINRSQISNTPGTTKLLLKLYPENLGSVRIEIMQQDGVLSARLLTTTAMGKELLESQLQQLKNAFANANIQMDRIDIAQSLQEADRNLKDQSQFGHQFKQQTEQEETEQDEQEDDSEKISFSDFLINEGV